MLNHSAITGFLGIFLETVILWRGYKRQLLRHYPPFYAYIAAVLLIALIRHSVLLGWGNRSQPYFYAYHWLNFFFPPLQLWVLSDLVKVGSTKKNRLAVVRLATISGLLAIPVGIGVWASDALIFEKLQAFLLAFQALFCVGVCKRVAQSDIRLGRNLQGILFGLSILMALQSFNFVYRVCELTQTEKFNFATQYIYLMILIFFLWHLWDFQPSGTVPAVARELLKRAGFQLERILKELLLR
ncbi:MAG: hypothetical protein HY645_08045 [Acidobacteria bacterium]|nr:hypothetical protein [Acidobacteriota bacterium]